MGIVQLGRIARMVGVALTMSVVSACALARNLPPVTVPATHAALFQRIVPSEDAIESARVECQQGEHWRFVPDPLPAALLLTDLNDRVFYRDSLYIGENQLPEIDQLIWQVEFHGLSQITMLAIDVQGTPEPLPTPFMDRCVVKIRAMTGEVLFGANKQVWATFSPDELATFTPMPSLVPYVGPAEPPSSGPYP